jgi:hypothetical protein
MRTLFEQVRGQIDEAPIITVGGSAFFDIVADELAQLAGGESRVILSRLINVFAGAYR